MNKICTIHNEEIIGNHKARCKKCANEAVSRRRRLIKLKAIEYKGGKCSSCGYNKCTTALAFHHLDPTKKDFSISRKGNTRSWDKIKTELDKCILLCQNCHAELHEAQFKAKDLALDIRLNNFNPNKLIIPTCPKCNGSMNKGKMVKQCSKCYLSTKATKIVWPNINELILMVDNSSYVSVGKNLGVSDNAVRKRILKYKK